MTVIKNGIASFTLEPVRNSTLNAYRERVLQLPPKPHFVNKYLRFGTLVDALITEPDRFDSRSLCLSHTSRYDDMNYFYSEAQVVLAMQMRDAYLAHPLLATIHSHGSKFDFTPRELTYSFEGHRLLALTGGEVDQYAQPLRIGTDIKSTAAKTLNDFVKSFHQFNYGQQGAFYMDSLNLDRYLFVGISRTVIDPRTRLPELFIIPLTRQSTLYSEGRDTYSYWLGHYLAEKEMLVAA